MVLEEIGWYWMISDGIGKLENDSWEKQNLEHLKRLKNNNDLDIWKFVESEMVICVPTCVSLLVKCLPPGLKRMREGTS